jgi:hypothetical protein
MMSKADEQGKANRMIDRADAEVDAARSARERSESDLLRAVATGQSRERVADLVDVLRFAHERERFAVAAMHAAYDSARIAAGVDD